MVCLTTRAWAADDKNPVLVDWRPYEQLPPNETAGIAPYCPGGFVDPMRFDPDVDPNRPDAEVPLTFTFNRSPNLSQQEAVLIGEVSAKQNTFQVFADQIHYERSTNTGNLQGNVRLRSLGYLITGGQTELDFDARTSRVDQANFVLHREDIHGSARQLSRQGDSIFEGESVTFTRCMPHDPDWQIRAASLQVNRDMGVVKAWHARFAIKSVPVFYLPYVSFPFDDRRRSGFVTSTYGANELFVPYYFNLAPNYDDTLTLGYFVDLGVLARNEFRFLTRNHNGISDIDWQLTQEAQTQEGEEAPKRWSISHKQSGQLGSSAGYNFNTRWVSDVRYDQNFNNGGEVVKDQTVNLNLTRKIDASTLRFNTLVTTPVQDSSSNFHTAKITASTRIDSVVPSILGEWQEPKDDTVTAGQFGLKRLPEISLSYKPADLPGKLTLDNTITYSHFSRQLDEERLSSLTASQYSLATETQRYHLNTGIAYPFDVEWGYLRPELEGIYLAYDQDNELDPGFDFKDDDFIQNPEIGVWRFTVDGKVIAERPYASPAGLVVHSVEPRLHYTYTPYRDQDSLPNLNTSVASDDFKPFTKTRFSGLDRIGDMNRISAALDNRLRDKTSGREILFIGLSKALKLEQERVTKGNAEPLDEAFTAEYSPTYLGLRWSPEPMIQLNASAKWAHRTMDLESFSTDLTFLPSGNSFVRLAATGDDEAQNAAVSGYWPVRENIAVIGYANWERPVVDDEGQGDFRYTDLIYGLDYDNCCWNIRLVSFDSVIDQEETEEDALFPVRSEQGIKFEFTLKGMGGSSGDVESLLDTKVPGYRGRLYHFR